MVRPPRFEPGSSAWQADVLDQTRLRPLGTSVNPITDKNLTTQTEAKIANTLIQLKTNGRTTDQTIKRIATNLTRLAKQCNLDNPEEVKLHIAEMQTTDQHTRQKKKADNQIKNKYASTYNHYCITNNINWKKPYCKVTEKTPLIPTPQDVQSIIDNSSEDYATIFTIEAEIACCPEELYQVTARAPSAHSHVPDDRPKSPRVHLLFKKLQSASKESGDIFRTSKLDCRVLFSLIQESTGQTDI